MRIIFVIFMLGISIVLFRGNSSPELNLFSYIFHHNYLCFQFSTLLNLRFYSTFLHIFYFFSLLPLVRPSVKYLLLLISSKYAFTLLIRIYCIIFYMLQIFDCHISNIANWNIFVWLFLSFNVFLNKILYIDNIIEKVAYAVSYIYISVYMLYVYTHFWCILSINNFF